MSEESTVKWYHVYIFAILCAYQDVMLWFRRNARSIWNGLWIRIIRKTLIQPDGGSPSSALGNDNINNTPVDVGVKFLYARTHARTHVISPPARASRIDEIHLENIHSHAQPYVAIPSTAPFPPVDITNAVRHFYANDPVLSCATLQRWLGNFYDSLKFPLIDVIFIRRSTIYVAKLNLSLDLELHSNTESSDVDLNVLEGRIIYAEPIFRTSYSAFESIAENLSNDKKDQ